MTNMPAPESSAILPVERTLLLEEARGHAPLGPTLRRNFQESFGALPWWLISATVHIVFIFLSMIIVVGSSRQPLPDIELVKVDLTPPPVEKKKEDLKIELTKKAQVNLETKSDQVFYTPEKVEITDARVETENEVQSEMPARGQEDAISTIPAEGKGAIGIFGVGGGGRAGAFGWRMGGGRKSMGIKNGGSEGSETSVDLALEWLARHQSPDGKWETDKLDSNDKQYPAIAGLAALAFLGAGHTEKHGKYKDTVKRAVQYLISEQNSTNGHIAEKYVEPWHQGKGAGYNHAMAGLALAEASGMGRDPQTKEAAQKALDWSLAYQNQDKQGYSRGGFRYEVNMKGDMSVTGWFAMQLKSCKMVGMQVPPQAFQGIMDFVDSVTAPASTSNGNDPYTTTVGWIGYQLPDTGRVSTTAMGMLARIFLGFDRRHPLMQGGAQILMKNLPKWGRGAGNGFPFYYWYYGTLVMFQMGGNYWQAWNDSMRDMLIEKQRRDGDALGSWDVMGNEIMGGRAYTTALGALCLEVYYRYLPMYKD